MASKLLSQKEILELRLDQMDTTIRCNELLAERGEPPVKIFNPKTGGTMTAEELKAKRQELIDAIERCDCQSV